MTDKEKIQNMKEGETIYLNMFNDGGVQIHMYNHEYQLYEIPLYGGHPQFYNIYEPKNIDNMIKEYQSWT